MKRRSTIGVSLLLLILTTLATTLLWNGVVHPTVAQQQQQHQQHRMRRRPHPDLGEQQQESQDGNNNNNNNHQFPIVEEHSFQAPFLMSFGTGSIPHWEYGGSTLITENYVRLVPAVQSRTGYMYNTEPLSSHHGTLSQNWRVDLRFQIHNTHSPGADGLGFWYIEKPELTSGPLYGQKEFFNGLGIIFDSYDNNANGDGPSVIAIRGTGDMKTKWDLDNDLLANQLDRCRSDFRNALGGTVTARITYQHERLTVDIDTVGAGRFSSCISIDDIQLPSGYYFQLTAATGGLADNHDVFSFVTYDLSANAGNGGGGRRQVGAGGAGVGGAASAGAGQQHYNNNNGETVEGDGESHRRGHHGWYDPYKHYRDQLANKDEEGGGGAADKVDDSVLDALATAKNKRKGGGKKRGRPQQQQQQQRDDSPPDSYLISEPADDDQVFKVIEEKLKGMDKTNSGGGNNRPSASTSSSSSSSPSNNIAEQEKELSINTRTNLLILEALEEVAKTVKVSSTKEDITNIINQISDMLKKQHALQSELSQLKDTIKTDLNGMMRGLEKENQNLHSGISKLEKYISSLNVQVDDLTAKQGRLHSGFEEHSNQLRTTIKSSTSYAFWIFFILFQTAFVVGFMYYKKYADIKSAKLY